MSALGIATSEIDARALGFDSSRLSRLDNFLQAATSAGRIPGWFVAITRHGRVAHVGGGGFRDVDAELPIEDDTPVPDVLDDQTGHRRCRVDAL